MTRLKLALAALVLVPLAPVLLLAFWLCQDRRLRGLS